MIGAGTGDDPRRPNVPEGVGYSIVEWHEDGTVTVKLDESFLNPARDMAARLDVYDKVRAGALTDAEVATVAPLFDPLTAGLQVATGDVYRWDGTLVEALQPHTVEAWWLDLASLPPSLYKVHRTETGDGPVFWQAGITLNAGEQTAHEGVTYDVLQTHTAQEHQPPGSPGMTAIYRPVED